MNPLLVIESLSKRFSIHQFDKTITGCHDVSFHVEPGAFVGITGRSGSGKSTILKLVYRTYLPEKGAIWYESESDGSINLSEADERAILRLRRREIGYVSQFLQVIPRTTAREIVQRAALESGRGAAEAAAVADEMLTHFELDESLRDSYPNTFSGGEKLRLNLAQAMVRRPRLLLLDEPTASLDAHSKARVRELIERLKSEGTTMLGIFHDIEFMGGLCDHEYAMEAGRFIA